MKKLTLCLLALAGAVGVAKAELATDTTAVAGNLLKNVYPTADFSYWTRNTDGGSGWAVNASQRCFSSSSTECVLTQGVSLAAYNPAAGRTIAYIGAQFAIPYPGETSYDIEGECGVYFDVLASDSTTLILTDTLFAWTGKALEMPWTQVRDTLLVPAGAAYARVRFVGDDQQDWAGQYGPRFRGAYIVVDDSYQPATGITLSSAEETLAVAERLTIAATVAPADVTFPGVCWSSSDERVATVDASGVVTARHSGTALIIATAADPLTVVRESCTVTVNCDTTDVAGNLLQNVFPTGGFDYWTTQFADKNSLWEVDGTLCCFKSSFQTGTISQTVSLKDYHPATGLDSAYLGVQYSVPGPDDYYGLLGVFVDWLAADSSVVRTDTLVYKNAIDMETSWRQLRDTVFIPRAAAYGRVRLTGKDQKNWVGAWGPRFRGAYMAVRDGYVAPAAIALNQHAASVYYGETLDLTATVLPAEATWPTVEWTCSDDSVATVTADGTVRAVGPGTALIIAQTTDSFAPTVRDMCVLTVSIDTTDMPGNLLQNVFPTGGFDYWTTQFADKYSQWAVSAKWVCFCSSRETGTISQSVSLADYHPASGLDSAYIGVQYDVPSPDHYYGLAGVYFDWLAADSSTVVRTDTLLYKNEMQMQTAWTQLGDTVWIPTTAAYGRVRLTGKDQNNWLGAYGPRFRGAYIAVADYYDGSDDETTVLDAANDTTEEVTKYLYNGQLFIRRGGAVYTALGQPIKQEK